MEISEENAVTIPINNNHQTEPQPSTRRRILSILLHGTDHGAKPLPLAAALTVGLIIRFAIPKPATVTSQAWQLLAIFLFTITGLVAAPLPTGGWSMICISVALITKTLSFSQALTAVTSEVLWLIVISFFFARGFAKSGLGERVAAYAVRWMGRSTIGLSYSLVVAEAVVAPAIPSSTARAGGVFCPVIKSLAVAGGSLPKDKSARKLGAYLMLSQFQEEDICKDWI